MHRLGWYHMSIESSIHRYCPQTGTLISNPDHCKFAEEGGSFQLAVNVGSIEDVLTERVLTFGNQPGPILTCHMIHTRKKAGLGMLGETRNLLDLWSENMSTEQLNQAALESGRVPRYHGT